MLQNDWLDFFDGAVEQGIVGQYGKRHVKLYQIVINILIHRICITFIGLL